MKIKKRTIDHFSTGRAYTMYNGELVNVEILSYTLFLADFSIKYVIKLPNGDVDEVCDNAAFYDSIKDYESGNEKQTFETGVASLFNMPIDAMADDFSPYCWVFENGEPKRVYPEFRSVSVSKNDTKYDGEIPDKWYESREEALRWNDYHVQEKDGNIHIRKALFPLLVLTDEQKEAVQAISDAYKKARELGVRFIWDSENETIGVFNANHLSYMENEDDYSREQKIKRGELPENDDAVEIGSQLGNYRAFRTDIKHWDFWINCDYSVYVKPNKD